MSYDRVTAGRAALGFARELTGRPYVYGGTWPQSGGTDCSGLWEWAYQQVGIYLPRTTYDQFKIHQIPASWPSEPGDLLFIAGSDAIGSLPGHVMGFVAPGQIFQAEETGTNIGQFAYDTSQFAYRTRPGLAAPLAPVAPPPVAGSAAAILGASARPLGPLPLLEPGKDNPQEWVEYERRLGRVLGLWPKRWSLKDGEYGARSQNLTVRSKAHFKIPMNGTRGDRVCGARVFNAYGVR